MVKGVLFNAIGQAEYRDIKDADVYLPTVAEQQQHGANVITRPLGDPHDDEIQVEAIAGGICTHEISIFTGELTVPRFPWLAGHEAVHRVLKTGKDVRNISEGDLVSCCWYHGQWTGLLNGPADSAYLLPDPIEDPACWLVEPVASVVNGVGHFGVRPGDRIMVIGAGFMGLLITQALNHHPLSELVVSEIKEMNRNMASDFGATEIVNSAEPGGMDRLAELEAEPFDIVVECSGSQAGLDDAVRLTREGGTICLFAWHRKRREIDLSTGHLRGQRLLNTSPGIDIGRAYNRHWPIAIRLMERGMLDLSRLVTHRYDAGNVQTAMSDCIARPEGFIKAALLPFS